MLTKKDNKEMHYYIASNFKVAMEGTVPMLIWLGRQQLGQKNEPKEAKGFDRRLGEFLDHLKNMKKGGEGI